MKKFCSAVAVAVFLAVARAWRYDPELTDWNLNQNQYALVPTDYWGEWTGHEYHPSPKNWRFPFYTLFLDRFVNGDPNNDNANGTTFEHDITSNQMRHGGDLQGLVDTLDYIQGMGIKGLYIAGSPFMNLPWEYDSYSPVDLSLLDQHFGTITVWRMAIDEIHRRGMYIVLDNTFATLSDLIGFDGYLNTTTPFTLHEHQVQYKTSRQYADFSFGNSYNKTCDYPKFWNETGFPVESYVTGQMSGCYDSEFDQYGDTEAFGVYPDWRRQLSKFASVQDRLREWHPPVRAKLENFYCMAIAMLDVDGFRYDKAMQSTVDAMGFMNDAMRTCARRYGKENFFLPGEITGGNTAGAIYVGRGRQPNMLPETLVDAVALNNQSADTFFLRSPEHAALDAAAFHYTVYRTLTRFLGMDGNLEAGYDAPRNWVDMWNTFLLTNDFINANTGEFDPRHMYGATNQDVFRWPGVENGVNRMVLGLFIATIHMPGIPLVLWGEEQSFYVLDNTAENYIFGRQPMSGATAWQDHGCYSIDSVQYYNWPIESARHGCSDDSVSYDHRDPSAPVRNIMRHMYDLRDNYPVLNDGAFLQQLSNITEEVVYPGSSGVITETGLWSVLRMAFPDLQNLTGSGQGETPVWLIYSNLNRSRTYEFDCRDNATGLNTTSLISPFDGGTIVKNLFPPYDELILSNSTTFLGLNSSTNPNGCLDEMYMDAYEFRAYVPWDKWVAPRPTITKFVPGHDARLVSAVASDGKEDVKIEIHFSAAMDCDSVTNSLGFGSSMLSKNIPFINPYSVQCGSMYNAADVPEIRGAIPSTWRWSGTLENVHNGVHSVTVRNASAEDGWGYTNSIDRFLFRIGQHNNPMVFPRSANYSSSILTRDNHGNLYANHSAEGADLWRFSTNWGSTFSEWMPYTGGMVPIDPQAWSGSDLQKWKGQHIRVEYWSSLTGSSDHVQQGDLDWDKGPRRFPHLFWNGPYNQYGYDAGPENEIKLNHQGLWDYHFLTEWPAIAQVNVWGLNPDGKPDQQYVMGDADGDSVLDRMPPSQLSAVIINITAPPPLPYLGWRIHIHDGTNRFQLLPSGSMWWQLILYVLLAAIPVISAVAAVWSFMQSFYGVKFNEIGISEKGNLLSVMIKKYSKLSQDADDFESCPSTPTTSDSIDVNLWTKFRQSKFLHSGSVAAVDAPVKSEGRRTVLIATMEYDIEDWEIKIKIGGLGVMAQLMGKNLSHQDLIWVVPCVGGVDYPVDHRAAPMTVKILGNAYKVQVQYHKMNNITYVLLDAPTFRQQTKAEPYPARMDDLNSAIYYSAWNQCIAQAIERFPVDLYHINDYHGCIAPLYLLPATIPVCLSLHNAEFQGLWPMRTRQECEEVSGIFNLSSDFVQRFVQFGEVFNLLHAGASYLRVYQQGFGAVGVSKKYGKRSYLRYPIFWGLKKVGQLPNPDPSDTGEWDKKLPREEDITVDPAFEASRPELKRQAQEWAGLEQNPEADLFVFVGRWSMQKGVDLIADVFPALLESRPNVQLVCIGPVIDLYGKFAALKLDRMMKLYPGRVFSKPVFTALPPYIFSGAEFALIPSRDEPFGLVAVEFGRKGALGVGARVGGLGQMPGWWYTIESMQTAHLLKQFKMAIEEALNSKDEVRAVMRARSAKQRFPVAQWVEDLEILQSTALRLHNKKIWKRPTSSPVSFSASSSIVRTTPPHSRPTSSSSSRHGARAAGVSRPSTGTGARAALRRLNGHSYSAVSPLSPDDSDNDDESSPLGPRDAVADVNESEDITAHSAALPSLQLTNDRDEISQISSIADSEDDEDDGPAPLLTQAKACEVVRVHREAQMFVNKPNSSLLSLEGIVGDKKDFKLQQTDPFFTDSTGEYYDAFGKKLDTLKGSNSESQHCIEEYLMKSEKKFFGDYRNAKLGRSGTSSLYSSNRSVSEQTDSHNRDSASGHGDSDEKKTFQNAMSARWSLGDDYKPPTGLRNWMQIRIGDWPVYAFFLAFGQIIAANSYQITLLTGEIGQKAEKLYVICSVYLAASLLWWLLFRKFGSLICLTLPFLFYGAAFLLIGVAHYAATPLARGWIQNVGTGAYAVASASGSLFFALNFGDEGGATVRTWVFRACVIQGTQQIYVVLLWFWGSYLNRQSTDGLTYAPGYVPLSQTWKITAISLPVAFALWTIGTLMYFGLPTYYRQTPGIVPGFYKSLTKRKIILWFFVTVLIQNFTMSAQYGRNWSFLFSSQHATWWQIYCLIIFFFVILGAGMMYGFSKLTHSHSWILPIFAIGLGAPRWAQIWWGTSNIGQWLPWAPGGLVSSAVFSRSLWLWLGVLDTVQGVGIGMILLGTLTRVHVVFTLIVAQVLGSAATALARAYAPNAVGPGPISPDISAGISTIFTPWFWIALILNLAICVGFFKFFRKEQLTKP